MSVITAKGKQVKENVNQKKVDMKKVYIRLKDGETVKVRILGVEDYVEYKAHGSFTHGIYTQPCVAPTGVKCPMCVASKSGEGDFDALYQKNRYLFAMADIETGELRVWDATKNQAKKLIAQIEEYAEDLQDVAFNFKRTGTGTDTSYTLNPILRLKGDDQEKFNKFNGESVEIEFFEAVLQPKTLEFQVRLLKEAGFPIENYFDAELVAKATEEKDSDVKPIENDEITEII